MPRSIDSTFTGEKNSLSNKPIFIYALYNYDGGSNNLYFTNYDADIVYDGITYTAFPIYHEDIGENSSGQIEIVRIHVGNVSRLIQAYLETYDLRRKKFSIKQVFTNQLADTDAYLEEIFYIDSYSADQNEVVFSLSSKLDILNVNLPLGRYPRNHCPWKFKGNECGYSGAETSCDKTFDTCRKIMGNQTRYGGFPSIPPSKIFF